MLRRAAACWSVTAVAETAAGGGEGRHAAAKNIHFEGMHMRSDIGARALAAGRKGN